MDGKRIASARAWSARAFRFYRRCFVYAWGKAWGLAALVGGIIRLVVPAYLHRHPQAASAMSDLTWEIPSIIVIVAGIARLAIAPFVIYDEDTRATAGSEDPSLFISVRRKPAVGIGQIRSDLFVLNRSGKQAVSLTFEPHVVGSPISWRSIAFVEGHAPEYLHLATHEQFDGGMAFQPPEGLTAEQLETRPIGFPTEPQLTFTITDHISGQSRTMNAPGTLDWKGPAPDPEA